MRYALAVAEEGSFRDAADRLDIAQPALSRGVAQLERELGVELFSRRPTRLTASGKLFIERARQILADVDTAVTATRLADRGELGPVTLGYDCTAASHPIPELSHELHQRYPGLEVQARELSDADLVGDLAAGAFDVAIGHDLPEASGIARRVLGYEPVAAVLHIDHPLAGRTRLDLRELHGETYRTAPRHETPRLPRRHAGLGILEPIICGLGLDDRSQPPRVLLLAQWPMLAEATMKTHARVRRHAGSARGTEASCSASREPVQP